MYYLKEQAQAALSDYMRAWSSMHDLMLRCQRK